MCTNYNHELGKKPTQCFLLQANPILCFRSSLHLRPWAKPIFHSGFATTECLSNLHVMLQDPSPKVNNWSRWVLGSLKMAWHTVGAFQNGGQAQLPTTNPTVTYLIGSRPLTLSRGVHVKVPKMSRNVTTQLYWQCLRLASSRSKCLPMSQDPQPCKPEPETLKVQS